MKTRSLEPKQITIGNHTYISLLVSGSPHHKARDILVILNQFESEHPELEIASWNIEKHIKVIHENKGAFGSNGESSPDYYIDGLWVNHRPRKGK